MLLIEVSECETLRGQPFGHLFIVPSAHHMLRIGAGRYIFLYHRPWVQRQFSSFWAMCVPADLFEVLSFAWVLRSIPSAHVSVPTQLPTSVITCPTRVRWQWLSAPFLRCAAKGICFYQPRTNPLLYPFALIVPSFTTAVTEIKKWKYDNGRAVKSKSAAEAKLNNTATNYRAIE